VIILPKFIDADVESDDDMMDGLGLMKRGGGWIDWWASDLFRPRGSSDLAAATANNSRVRSTTGEDLSSWLGDEDNVSLVVVDDDEEVGAADEEDEEGERSEKILSRFGFKFEEESELTATLLVVAVDGWLLDVDDNVGEGWGCPNEGAIAFTVEEEEGDNDDIIALLLLDCDVANPWPLDLFPPTKFLSTLIAPPSSCALPLAKGDVTLLTV